MMRTLPAMKRCRRHVTVLAALLAFPLVTGSVITVWPAVASSQPIASKTYPCLLYTSRCV